MFRILEILQFQKCLKYYILFDVRIVWYIEWYIMITVLNDILGMFYFQDCLIYYEQYNHRMIINCILGKIQL